MGDILRAEIASGSKDSELISETIKKGGCLPFDFFWGMVDREMKKAGWTRKFLLDGFPRSAENNQQWQENESQKYNFACLLHFDVDEETVTTRIMERAKSSGRIDDNLDSLKKRLNAFNEIQIPIIKGYAD